MNIKVMSHKIIEHDIKPVKLNINMWNWCLTKQKIIIKYKKILTTHVIM